MVNISGKIQPVILVILDGWGIAPPSQGNAITLAKTPFFNFLKNKYPYTELCAYGRCVGLPKDQPGNSEAGHLNLGVGRIVKDDAVYISESIKDGTFFKNPAFLEGINYLKKNKSKVHLIGLVTEENSAHSSPEHWLAALQLFERRGIEEIFLHLFTDGRDSPQHAAINILKRFEIQIKNNHQSHIKVRVASLCGRFYAMDRTKKWDRTEKVYNLLTLGSGLKVMSAEEAIIRAYNRKETDEFLTPSVIVDKDQRPIATINDGDLIVFMNLRSDRARQLTKVFVQKDFNRKNRGSFERKKWPNAFFIALTDFGPDLDRVRTAYPSREIRNSLPVLLKNFNQLYIAETEKYAHITFFFNGGYDEAVAGEQRIRIPSPSVLNYDMKPEMATAEICQKILSEIKNSHPDFITVNFCNPDMLGHTGNIQAAIQGIEFLDKTLERLVDFGQKEKYVFIVTADHGNAEEMIDLKTNEIVTSHTINPVPFILVGDFLLKNWSRSNKAGLLEGNGQLSDVAPTILDLMGVREPKEMTGNSLIIKDKVKIL